MKGVADMKSMRLKLVPLKTCKRCEQPKRIDFGSTCRECRELIESRSMRTIEPAPRVSADWKR